MAEHTVLAGVALLCVALALGWANARRELLRARGRADALHRDLCREVVCPHCPLYVASNATCRRGVKAGPAPVADMPECPLGQWSPRPLTPGA